MMVASLLAACGGSGGSGGTTASRDQWEAQYGVGNGVVRHGVYVPNGLPLNLSTTTTISRNSTGCLIPWVGWPQRPQIQGLAGCCVTGASAPADTKSRHGHHLQEMVGTTRGGIWRTTTA